VKEYDNVSCAQDHERRGIKHEGNVVAGPVQTDIPKGSSRSAARRVAEAAEFRLKAYINVLPTAMSVAEGADGERPSTRCRKRLLAIRGK